jgi:RNA polymerase sigma factor (sigma-70 family)
MIAFSESLGEDPRFALAQAGCQASQNALLRQHDGLVQAAVRQQVTGSAPFAELVQAGRIGLWRAILGYDPQRGIRFASYAWPCIVHAIWRAARACRPPRVGLPPERRAVTDPAHLYLEAQVQRELHALVARLPDRERLIIVRRYGLDGQPPTTLAQLGQQLGLSRERVRQVQQAALLWLQQPAHAQALRSWLDRHTADEYARAAAQQAAWRAHRRGGRDD